MDLVSIATGQDLATDAVSVEVHPHPAGGIQVEFHFANGYGASIINNAGSYGVELAILHEGDGTWPIYAETTMPRAVADRGVVPWIADEAELRELLAQIRDIGPASATDHGACRGMDAQSTHWHCHTHGLFDQPW